MSRTDRLERLRGNTQVGRVHNALVQNPDGITAQDFSPPAGGNVIDGGSQISRLAARIMELRDLGYGIVSHGKRNGFTVYRLVDATRRRLRPDQEWRCTEDTCAVNYDPRGFLGPFCPAGHPAKVVTVIYGPGTQRPEIYA